MTAEEAQHHPWLSKVEGLSLNLGGPHKGTGVVPIDEVGTTPENSHHNSPSPKHPRVPYSIRIA